MINDRELLIYNERIILFDGICNLCSVFMRFVYKYDKTEQIKFAWIQSTEAQAVLEWAGLPTTQFDTIIFIDHLKVYQKSTAFLKITAYFVFPWTLLRIGFIVPRFIRDWIYEQVAQHRYRLFGKRENCLIPTGDLKSRFIRIN
jgi:predicted DCC family thiol-disulfide oxidoreductase YuxK